MEYLMLVMILIWILNIILGPVLKRFGVVSDRNTLSCGIVAYSGNVPANPAWIKMLMMFNETRGEDSTGWAVNNKITKATDKVSKFIQDNPLIITPEDENFTLIAHARKRSSGLTYSKDLAHPFGFYQDSVEKENYDIVLVMNGTLSNTELLAKKWEVDYKHNTNSDTQMLTKAMAKLGWENDAYKEALELYDGNATLAFFNPNDPNSLMIYKDPDRTLYLWSPEEGQMYISSMEEPLYALGALKSSKEVRYFISNTLYKIVEGKIVHDELIVRTPLKPPVYQTNARIVGFNRKNYQSDYEASTTNYNNYDLEPERILLRKRAIDGAFHSGKKGNILYPINERYFKNGHPQTGKLYVTKSGDIKPEVVATSSKDTNAYYFVNGFMCKSEKDYDKVLSRCKDVNDNFDLKKFKSIRLAELVEYFEYPVVTIVDGIEKWILNSKYSQTLVKSGDKLSFTPFLSEESFSMIYRDSWTKTTRKIICEIGPVTKVNDPLDDDVMSDASETKTVAFLIGLFKKSESESPHYYHALVRKDLWNLNTSQTLKEYLFILLMRMARASDLITENYLTDLKSKAKESLYSGKDFITSMENIVRLLKKKFKEELPFTLNSKLSTKDKIKILEENEKAFSEEDIILSISNCNSFFANLNFKNDVYEAKSDFNELKESWVSVSTSKETFDFNEAILLCLNIVQRVSNSELLYALESHHVDLNKKVCEIYNEWALYTSDANDLNTKDEEPVTDTLVDPQLLEIKDSDYYQKEFQSQSDELLEQAKDLHERIAKIEDECKNENLVALEANLANTIRYMEKNIKSETIDLADKN